MRLYVTIDLNQDQDTRFCHINGYNQIKTKYPTSQFVICREIGDKAKKVHLHIYFDHPDYEYSDDTRIMFRRYFQTIFDGVVRVSKEEVYEKIRAVAYTMKDGDYKCYNIDWLTFIKAKVISHPKKLKFQQEYKNWFERVKTENLTQEDATASLLSIYVRHYVPFNYERICGQVRSAYANKDKDYFKAYVKRVLEEL